MKDRDRLYASLDRKPWSSVYFSIKYEDDQDFPWALYVTKTGRLVCRFMRKFAAQHEAEQLDAIIGDVL